MAGEEESACHEGVNEGSSILPQRAALGVGRRLEKAMNHTSATGLREINADVRTMSVVYPSLVLVNKYLVGCVNLLKFLLCLELALRWGSVGMCLECALLIGPTNYKR